MLAHGAFRVAYFYERPDTSTFRYRVHNMVEALREAGIGVAASWFTLADLALMDDVLSRVDVLVLCRTRYSGAIAHLISRARAHGVRILFDVDDLVFDDRYAHLVLDTLDQQHSEDAWNHWFAYFARLGAVLRLCDGAIVTNTFLGERVRDFCGLDAAVVPNFLNAAQVGLSRRILRAKMASRFGRDGRIHLGYFSGTPTHNRDFAIAAPAIADLLADDPRIKLRIVGFLDPSGPLAAFRERVEVFPLQDFLTLQRLIGEVELNLIPLQDNTFTNCKSELKFFEAAAVGTLSIASPSFTLRAAIRDGTNGFLATAQSWPVTLRRALDRLPDYAGMAIAAAEEVLNHYAPANQVNAIAAALGVQGKEKRAGQQAA